MTRTEATYSELAMVEWASWWNETMLDKVDVKTDSFEIEDGVHVAVATITAPDDPSLTLEVRIRRLAREQVIFGTLSKRWHDLRWSCRAGATTV